MINKQFKQALRLEMLYYINTYEEINMEDKVASARALLALGRKPKDVAEKTGLAYQKVTTLKRTMEAEERDKAVGALSPVALDVIIEKAKDEEVPKKIIDEMSRIQEGLHGLAKLDSEFHDTFSVALKRATAFLNADDLKASEWVAITNSLGNAYNNIFNNAGVNVHVDNSTKVSNNSLSMFKGSVRG